MIREKRMLETFAELVRFDSETFHERAVGEYLAQRLRGLGLAVRTDVTDPGFLEAHPESFPNLYAVLRGNCPREPVLFSAHLDTVPPGKGKRAVPAGNGLIRSAGDTVLGADDLCGIVSILEALSAIQEDGTEHGDIEVLLSPAEEAFCEGTRHLDMSVIRSETAYVLDLQGKAGRAASAAPSILSFEVGITGRAAHAGFEPEKGISAITIAADAIRQIPVGRTGPDTSVNIGTIRGGSGRNIVPDSVRIEGEIRSFDHAKALAKAEEIFRVFREHAGKRGGKAACSLTEHIRGYALAGEEPAVRRFLAAAAAAGLAAELTESFGGSDANRLNAAGIRTIVLACGMESVHTTEEYAVVSEMKKAAELTLRLMTMTEKRR